MAKIKLLIEIDSPLLDGLNDDELNWYIDEVFQANPEDGNNCLILHSNLIGEELGAVKVLEVING